MPTEKDMPAWWKDLKLRYEGKIKCPCGNDKWDQFLYVGAGDSWSVACKQCGKVVTHDSPTA